MKEAVLRVKMRASVLSTLDQRFLKTDADEELKETNISQSRGGYDINCIKVIQDMFCDSSDRTYNNLRDQLYGKSLILDNSKMQSDAVKAATKLKNKMNRIKTMSKSKLKKFDIPLNDSSIQKSTLLTLSESWLKYISFIMQDSKSIVQLQARVAASEMVGAKVMLVESPQLNLVGLEGVIVRESQNCYFIGVISSPTPVTSNASEVVKKKTRSRRKRKTRMENAIPIITTDNDDVINCYINSENSNRTRGPGLDTCVTCPVIMVLKSSTSLAIKLPKLVCGKSASSLGSESICVLHARNKLFQALS